MRPRPRIARDPDEGVFGERASLVAAAMRERDATGDGFEPMPERDAMTAEAILPAKVLRAFTRMVPMICADPEDGSLHVDGSEERWSPPWFAQTMEMCRGHFGQFVRSGIGWAAKDTRTRSAARAFVYTVLRDEALQQALMVLHRMGRADLARDALHNILSGDA